MRLIPLLLAAALSASAADVTAERLAKAEREPENWLTYYGGYKSWRYSTSTTTFQQLYANWRWSGRLSPASGGMEECNRRCWSSTGDVRLSAQNHVFALDAATGEQIWRYDYLLPAELPSVYGNWNRGVAIAYGLVYLGTLDNHVVALDAKTGREAWNVEVENAKQCGCTLIAAPLVVKDMVITGVTGGDFGAPRLPERLRRQNRSPPLAFLDNPGAGRAG
ncbi:MAG: PQQ-binding-like beta-propeller repeat protein [Bryobacterales bacterium]